MNKKKPRAKLIGEDGNVFNLIAISKRALIKEGMRQEAEEMANKITTEAKSYGEALRILRDYVEIV